MTAQPDMPGPDTGSYEVIHLGGQAAVVVPVTDFLRLQALEQAATPHELEDARTPRRYWSGGSGTPPGRRRSSPPTKQGVGWACSGEPAGRLRRTGYRPGGRVPRRPAGYARGPGRDRLARRRSPPGRSFTYGSPDLRRLRVGWYRILYEITEDAIAVRHIARGTGS